MDITPAVVTPELASAALASPLLADAIKLAEWIGDGKEVTAEGELPPALAIEACELLGIELPEDATDDDYLEAQAAVWETAQEAGFITLNDEVASAAELPTDPEEVLRRWLRVAGTSTCIPDDPCAECVTVLAVLADAPEPVTTLALALVALDDFPSSAEEDEDEEDEVIQERDDQTIGHV